jgi:hypothetical protein
MCNTTAQIYLTDKATTLDMTILGTVPETVYAMQTSTQLAATSIAVQQQLTMTNEFVCETASAVCSNYAVANPVNDDKDASEALAVQGSKQSRTITVAFEITKTIVVDLNDVRQMTQTCFPAAPAVDPSNVSRVLSSWRSIQNYQTSMSDTAGHIMG